MLSGIKQILIISTPHDLPNFKKLFGDGSHFGIKLSYKEQPSPDGLAQAFILGEEFIGNEDVCLVLGDNIFYGAGLQKKLANAVEIVKNEKKAIIFGNIVKDPERYGVAKVDEAGNVISLEEKPEKPKSNYAVVGLYYYPNSVIQIAKEVKPSHRGELEITSVNESYLKLSKLKLEIFSRGFAWLDTGTHESLTEATEFVKAVEKRTGLKIACLEEIAYRMKFISDKEFDLLKKKYIKSSYGEYLQTVNRTD
jgi:glucose-1-phosphate thymidylyltransferase